MASVIRPPAATSTGTSPAYHIAAHADVPDIEADFVPDYEPGDPSGIKGVGEIGTVGTAAAIANAVWHATGSRRMDPAHPSGPRARGAASVVSCPRARALGPLPSPPRPGI